MFEMPRLMKPFRERRPDTQYRTMVENILSHGKRNSAQSGVDTISIIAPPPMRFKVENGFPLLTERNLATKKGGMWRQAIGEIFAFVNGARTHQELSNFGCYWWKNFVSAEKCNKRGLEEGDLGPGSYGAAFHDFPVALHEETGTQETFNQFKYLIQQIIELPHLKTHLVSPFIPPWIVRGGAIKQQVVVAPCHGQLFVHVSSDRMMTLTMVQRSGDLPIGVPQNMAQYFALLLAIAHVTNCVPFEYVHIIVDAHIYENQIAEAKEILRRSPRRFPTISMEPQNELFSFRNEHFQLSDYHPHGHIKIPAVV